MKTTLEFAFLVGIIACAVTLNWLYLAVAGAAGVFVAFWPHEPKRSRTSYLRGGGGEAPIPIQRKRRP